MTFGFKSSVVFEGDLMTFTFIFIWLNLLFMSFSILVDLYLHDLCLYCTFAYILIHSVDHSFSVFFHGSFFLKFVYFYSFNYVSFSHHYVFLIIPVKICPFYYFIFESYKVLSCLSVFMFVIFVLWNQGNPCVFIYFIFQYSKSSSISSFLLCT